MMDGGQMVGQMERMDDGRMERRIHWMDERMYQAGMDGRWIDG